MLAIDDDDDDEDIADVVDVAAEAAETSSEDDADNDMVLLIAIRYCLQQHNPLLATILKGTIHWKANDNGAKTDLLFLLIDDVVVD